MRKLILSLISLSFVGCGRQVLEFPEVNQCQFYLAANISDSAWLCVNTRTQAQTRLSISDSAMNHAQALSADDYKKSEAWVSEVRKQAEKDCKAQ